jgi:hypothetical protein
VRAFPPDHDPFAAREIVTTAVPSKRVIVVLRSDEKSDRYSLCRFPDGSVWWRADTFRAPEDPSEPESWIAYHGELTVGQVIERVPDCRRSVLQWTRDEVERGIVVTDSHDFHVRERRAHSLERLRRELEAVAADAAGRAA